MTSDPLQSHAAQGDTDLRWMQQALLLAETSIGMASPNPVVGCVLVRGELPVARGAHIYDQLDHAEIVALKEAETKAAGATAYVTLEPCAHTGRTGPCAVALVNAGVRRVVVATGDPNPLVSGRGIAILREAGIEVTVGVLAEQARALNDGFARAIRSGLPFVTLKAGVSLDGRIAPAPTDAPAPAATTYLTSPRSLVAVQRMRHASDAVLTGIGTVLHDNPLLTDRSGLPRRRPLLRVVLDSALRLPLDSRLVQSVQDDLLVFTVDAANPRAETLRRAGVAVVALPHTQSCELANGSPERAVPAQAGLALAQVLAHLGAERGILNLLVEAGSHLNRALLDAELVDKLRLFYAPLFLGERGVPLLAGEASLHPEILRTQLAHSGGDISFEAYLRDPWL